MTSDVQLSSLASQRRHALVVPREHGAWGMLLTPLLVGGVVGLVRGGRVQPLIWLGVAALSLFWLRTPLEAWLGTSAIRAHSKPERERVLRAIGMLSLIAALALAMLLWDGNHFGLFWLGAAVGAAFGLQAGLKKLGRNTRMAAQIIGALGLTSTAAAAYYVTTGRFSSEAYLLWLANWLFAGDQIHFVQLRIRGSRLATAVDKVRFGSGFLIMQGMVVSVLFAAWYEHWVSPWVLLAFVPVLLRGVAWFFRRPETLAVRRLGWTELAYAVTFSILLTFGFIH